MSRSGKTGQTLVARPRIFYGWWIVLGGMVGMTLNAGMNWHGLNAFVLPLSKDFSIGITTVVATLSLARLESAFIGPLEGYLVDRYGPRAMMFIGTGLMGLGFLVASVAPNFLILMTVLILGLVLGSSLGFSLPISTAVANWWYRKRGRAFGIMWLGISIGTLMVPIVNWFIETFGWRGAFRIMGIAVIFVGMPIAGLMRHRPQDYGLLPDADPPEKSGETPTRKRDLTLGSRSARRTEFTVWQAVKTPTFWYFTLSVSVRLGVTSAVATNAFILVNALGGSAPQASFLFLIQGIFSAPGRLFLSWAGDVLNKRYVMAASLTILGISILGMSRATTFIQLAILWVPYAISWGGLSALPDPLRADLFGLRNFASIKGATAPLQSLFALVAPVFAASMFERTGSYEFPLTVFSGFTFVGLVLILLATPPKNRRDLDTLT